jgi:hypothetical protein
VLRIFVYVPQSYAPDIKAGQKADVSVRELPGRVFQGTVTRTAGAIDPTSRTLLTEVQVPNPDGLLLSGSYATVRFKVQRPAPPLVVPQSALLIDANGVRVAVIDADGTLHCRPIQIGRDFGNEVEVLSGSTRATCSPRGCRRTSARQPGRDREAGRQRARHGQAMTGRTSSSSSSVISAAGCMVGPSYRQRTSRRLRRGASSDRRRRRRDGATPSSTATRRRGGPPSTTRSSRRSSGAPWSRT